MTRHQTRLRVLLTLAGTAAIALGLAPAAHAAPAQPGPRQPAKGVIITCERLGRLTGTSGHLTVDEPIVPIDGHGFVFFTVAARNVRLKGPDGTTYRFFGGGYDDVVRAHTDGSGAVLSESERYEFQVVGAHGVVGRIDFTERQGADGVDHDKDRGDCHLPQGDT